jgi:CheY-like chemotaxis protein
VSDNGAGIAIESQSKVFQEFTQFKKNELQCGGGSGLGLWISRQIMQLHGGSLNFKSDGEGTGCTFYLSFPIYKEDVHNIASITPIDSACPKALHGAIDRGDSRVSACPVESDDIELGNVPKRLRILVVDDSFLNRKMFMKTILAEDSVIIDPMIVEADDGDVAVDHVRASMHEYQPFHVVFMDSNMNRLSGPDAAKAMRTQLDYHGIIIGVTGDVVADDIQKFLQSGANRVITKPIKLPQLLDAMREEQLI